MLTTLIAQANAPKVAEPLGRGLDTSMLSMFVFIVFVLAAIGVVGWLMLKVLVRAAYPPPRLRKCPHCGKDLPD